MERGNAWLRWLDQTLGPLLLRIVALWRPRKSQRPSSPQCIGLVKAAALGDTILLSAVIKDLRRAFPKARLILFTGKSNSALARLLPDVTEAVELPIRNPWIAWREIGLRHCDWLIDADSWPRLSALWTCVPYSGWSLGFQTKGQHRHYAFDQVVEHRSDLHEIENYRNLIRSLGVPVGSAPEDFRTLQIDPETASPRFREFLQLRKDHLLVGLHLWPGGTHSELKEWPLERWCDLVSDLAQDSRLHFVLTGGPDDFKGNEELLALLPSELRERCLNASGLKLAESLVALRELGALISVNTGVLHLAAAVGTPVLGLHGPTNPKRWGPVGKQHVSLLAPHPFAGCLNLGFEYPDGPSSLLALEMEQVRAGWNDLCRKNEKLRSLLGVERLKQ